ncbi:uncharacterized protein IL334_005644 [Kwoniella shivajii]|uniref:Laccase n=1 Tax=Kwoniella shivajii TaxID=564305 RepID=A0ABZ1D3Q0_9TREE|nr:hypothetical protein IL334_005644 [Kwoniella shivajii]
MIIAWFLLGLIALISQCHALSILEPLLAPSLTGPDKSNNLYLSDTNVQERSNAYKRAYTDPNTFILSGDFQITNIPQTREFWFNIGESVANPDGYTRKVYTINGQFPGPFIELNTGDTLKVHVTNTLDIPQTIHWHGLTQNGTVHMDGVPGITQCPIPPGSSFTYEFPIIRQYGTFWYHSHYANTMADGIFGPLIIHSPDDPLQRGKDYDEDRILWINDWWHDQSLLIVNGLTSKAGYRGTVAAPKPDSILINGFGESNCSDVHYPSGATCDPPTRPRIPVPANKKIRFRIINPSSHSLLRVSIDNHEMEVIEADATPIYGPTIHEIPVAPAQRYSVIVNTDQGKTGDTFWIRVNVAAACQDNIPQWALGILQYHPIGDIDTDSTVDWPETSEWNDLESYDSPCRDLENRYDLVPRIVKDAYDPPLDSKSLSSQFGVFVDVNGNNVTGFAFNNITFQNQIYDPVLSIVETEGKYKSATLASVTYEQDGYVDLIINNLDLLDHPYHIHGNDFQVVKRGEGTVTSEQVRDMGLIASNPLRRDTIFISGLSYAVLRFRTDNPGVWTIHCHIGWHLAQGKLAVMIVRTNDVQKFDRPQTWQNLCAGHDIGEIGPARRGIGSRMKSLVTRSLEKIHYHWLHRYGSREN